MNSNFTDRVRKVLSMAREEATRLRHDYVGTEHILLGLIREGEGVAAAILTNLNVDLEELRNRIEERVESGKSDMTADEVPYTTRAKKVLEFSVAEARSLKHSYVGTEHLLLGLLREEGSVAGSVLHAHGATLEDARRSVAGLTPESGGAPPVPSSQEAVVYAVAGPGSDSLSAWVASIKQLVMELGSTAPDSEASRRLVEQIVAMLDSLKPPGRS